MNLEGITLKILTEELKQSLEGGKIYKIFAPSKDSLLLLINKDNATVYFLADFTGGSPLVYLPENLPERPDNPSPFCMLLRKHLEEGRITLVEQPGLERVITLHIDLIGANRQIITKHLILELTGKNSNIIFTDENNIIMDATRHIGKSQNSVRQILAGQPYLPPPVQEGLDFLATTAEQLLAAAQKLTGSFTQNLVAATIGIGNNTAEALAQRCSLPLTTTTLDSDQLQACAVVLGKLQEEIKTHNKFYGLINKRNIMKLILPYQPPDNDSYQVKVFPTLLAGLRYGASLIPVQIPDKELLIKTVETAEAKAKKKLKYLAADLATAENAEAQKIIADTLMAHLYEMTKGATQIKLPNIYDNTPLQIALAPQLTPSENAQAYYKKYNKYKRALGEIKQQQEETTTLLTYLESLATSLDTATTKNEINEIKSEIIDLGLLAKPRKKSPGQESFKPMTIVLNPTTTLIVGKNNKQNDFVTFKLGKANDLWFHVKNIPGSHVILKSTLPNPEEKDILQAAAVAAAFSKAKNSSKVPVDYTQKRFVKKPSGAKPGFVIYTDQQTLYVTPGLPGKN